MREKQEAHDCDDVDVNDPVILTVVILAFHHLCVQHFHFSLPNDV